MKYSKHSTLTSHNDPAQKCPLNWILRKSGIWRQPSLSIGASLELLTQRTKENNTFIWDLAQYICGVALNEQLWYPTFYVVLVNQESKQYIVESWNPEFARGLPAASCHPELPEFVLLFRGFGIPAADLWGCNSIKWMKREHSAFLLERRLTFSWAHVSWSGEPPGFQCFILYCHLFILRC